MVAELSHFNLNVAFLDFISRSYRSFSDNRWILAACAHCCYSQLNLTSDRLLSD